MPFTVEQKKHLFCLFPRLDNPILVRRQYIQDFNITALESTRLKGHHFSRVCGKISRKLSSTPCDFQSQRDWNNARFGARIIRSSSAISWPPQSPDLNPLDFSLWVHLGKTIFDANPQTVPNLMQTLENACGTIIPAQGVKAATNFEKRLHLRIQENGGHFQQLL